MLFNYWYLLELYYKVVWEQNWIYPKQLNSFINAFYSDIVTILIREIKMRINTKFLRTLNLRAILLSPVAQQCSILKWPWLLLRKQYLATRDLQSVKKNQWKGKHGRHGCVKGQRKQKWCITDNQTRSSSTLTFNLKGLLLCRKYHALIPLSCTHWAICSETAAGNLCHCLVQCNVIIFTAVTFAFPKQFLHITGPIASLTYSHFAKVQMRSVTLLRVMQDKSWNLKILTSSISLILLHIILGSICLFYSKLLRVCYKVSWIISALSFPTYTITTTITTCNAAEVLWGITNLHTQSIFLHN